MPSWSGVTVAIGMSPCHPLQSSDLPEVVQEAVAGIAADVPVRRSARVAAIDDVVEEHAGRLAHVDRLAKVNVVRYSTLPRAFVEARDRYR